MLMATDLSESILEYILIKKKVEKKKKINLILGKRKIS